MGSIMFAADIEKCPNTFWGCHNLESGGWHVGVEAWDAAKRSTKSRPYHSAITGEAEKTWVIPDTTKKATKPTASNVLPLICSTQ